MTQYDDGREQAGLKIIEQLGWGQNEGVRELDEDLWRIISEANFGTIWARPGMSLRDRELVCMAILIAIGAHGVAIHFKHAHKLGFTDDDLRELIIQTIPYAGLPRALQAMATFRRIKRRRRAEALDAPRFRRMGDSRGLLMVRPRSLGSEADRIVERLRLRHRVAVIEEPRSASGGGRRCGDELAGPGSMRCDAALFDRLEAHQAPSSRSAGVPKASTALPRRRAASSSATAP